MKNFIAFIKANTSVKSKLLLIFLFLILLPARSFYYQLNLPVQKPLVRAVNYQFSTPSNYPVNTFNIPAPYLSARSALVIDIDSKVILFQKNPNLKLLPASTTKIVTALVALDTYPLDQIITINSINPVGQVMELEQGEKITVENLLLGMLVASANDAAEVLAQNHPQGKAAFIKAMNQKVKDLNLTDTQFTNPTGLDDYGHYTTAHDLSLLAAHAMDNPILAKMVGIIGVTISDTDSTIFHELETINQLLDVVPGLSGVKTGWTELAGECLVAYTVRGDHRLITVVLGSIDRFGETSELINWAFTNHQWLELPSTIHF